jgi:hypothetical protein
MPTDIIPALAQLGAAGLIGWMWLSERRAAVEREQQLREAHAAILDERPRLEVLLRALDANTRAITALEAGQRQLVEVVRFKAAPPQGEVPP